MYKFDGNNLTNQVRYSIPRVTGVILWKMVSQLLLAIGELLENPKINHYSPCNGGYSIEPFWKSTNWRIIPRVTGVIPMATF